MTTPENDKPQAKLFTVHDATLDQYAVPVDAIDVPGIDGFDPDAVMQLADNIKRVGMIHAPTLIKHGKRFVALTGRRRCAAAKLLGLDTIRAHVRDAKRTSDVDQAALILSENAVRSANVLAELDSINVLLANGFDPKDVAASTGQHISWIRHRTILNKLHPTLMQHFKAGRIRFETAQQVARLDADQQKRVVETFAEKLEENEDAVLTMRDVDVTKSRPTVPLPVSMFSPFPTVEPTQPNHVDEFIATRAIVATDAPTEPNATGKSVGQLLADAVSERLAAHPSTMLGRLRVIRAELDALRPLAESMSAREALTRARSRVNAVIDELEEKGV